MPGQERRSYRPDRWIATAARRRIRRWAEDIRAHAAIVTEPNPLQRADGRRGGAR